MMDGWTIVPNSPFFRTLMTWYHRNSRSSDEMISVRNVKKLDEKYSKWRFQVEKKKERRSKNDERKEKGERKHSCLQVCIRKKVQGYIFDIQKVPVVTLSLSTKKLNGSWWEFFRKIEKKNYCEVKEEEEDETKRRAEQQKINERREIMSEGMTTYTKVFAVSRRQVSWSTVCDLGNSKNTQEKTKSIRVGREWMGANLGQARVFFFSFSFFYSCFHSGRKRDGWRRRRWLEPTDKTSAHMN